MAIETVELIDGIATNRDVAPSKRAYAAGILRMSYTSLRFSDAQRLRTCEVNEDSIIGGASVLKDQETTRASLALGFLAYGNGRRDRLGPPDHRFAR